MAHRGITAGSMDGRDKPERILPDHQLVHHTVDIPFTQKILQSLLQIRRQEIKTGNTLFRRFNAGVADRPSQPRLESLSKSTYYPLYTSTPQRYLMVCHK